MAKRVEEEVIKDLENPRFFDIADVINEDPELILDHLTADCVYFIPSDLDRFIHKKGRRGKAWPTERLLLFQIGNRIIDLYSLKSRLMQSLVFGPGDENVREQLYNTIKQMPDYFSGVKRREEQGEGLHRPKDIFITLPTLGLFDENTNVDKERIRNEIKEWINKFKQSVYCEMAEKLKLGITNSDKSIKTIHDEFRIKLKEIADLSNKINKRDNYKILGYIKDHIEEIEELYKENNEHWTIETADLIVLCYEFLILENRDIDEVFNRCLPRFDVKLRKLAENVP